MNYEKAYKEALERAKESLKDGTISSNTISYIEEIFPELKESEDEKIRKWIIENIQETLDVDGFFEGQKTMAKNAIAWLEKQGQVKYSTISQHENITDKEHDNSLISKDERIRKALIHLVNSNKELSFGIDNYEGIKWSDILAWLEKQGEQKPNKVEPKFKIGDIVRLKDGDGLEWTVEEVLNNGYYIIVCADRDDFIQLDDKWELVEQKPMDKIEPKFKVGDKIQYLKGCGTIMTIEKVENGEYIFANNLGHTTIEDGNKWYLVERNHTWSEVDENAIQVLKGIVKHSNKINEKIYTMPLKEKLYDWLKSIKDRVQPKQECSEEDEERIKSIISVLDVQVCWDGATGKKGNPYQKEIDWLKSLRPQNKWKPSDEQMHAFEQVYDWCNNNFASSETLTSLYNDLKKLKGE